MGWDSLAHPAVAVPEEAIKNLPVHELADIVIDTGAGGMFILGRGYVLVDVTHVRVRS